MKILIIEPFYGGSHKQFTDGLKFFSKHKIQLLCLKDKNWKWRMSSAALTLARRFNESDFQPDLIFVSDMLDLADFQALTKKRTHNVPFVLYMHENQITYPFKVKQSHDFHYGLINFKSCLCANAVWFNSAFHKNIFLETLPKFLKMFPSPNEKSQIKQIASKSIVLPIGLDLDFFDLQKPKKIPFHNRAVILWNHRWEHDKNPEQFYTVIKKLKARGIEFKLIILGEKHQKYPVVFDTIETEFQKELLHFGYAETKEEYAKWLWQADILPVTSNHDFFGISVVEAIRCNVIPLLPKRLAYPEHLPLAYENSFFYRNEKGLTNKLQRMIMYVSILRKQQTEQFVEKYNWKQLIERYDAEFDKLLANFA